MDHRECGLTWKFVCQSALYSPFKVSKLDFSATNLSLLVKDVLQMILWTEMLFAAIWRISVHKKCWLILFIVIVLLSSYLYRDKRSCPWPLVYHNVLSSLLITAWRLFVHLRHQGDRCHEPSGHLGPRPPPVRTSGQENRVPCTNRRGQGSDHADPLQENEHKQRRQLRRAGQVTYVDCFLQTWG